MFDLRDNLYVSPWEFRGLDSPPTASTDSPGGIMSYRFLEEWDIIWKKPRG